MKRPGDLVKAVSCCGCSQTTEEWSKLDFVKSMTVKDGSFEN